MSDRPEIFLYHYTLYPNTDLWLEHHFLVTKQEQGEVPLAVDPFFTMLLFSHRARLYRQPYFESQSGKLEKHFRLVTEYEQGEVHSFQRSFLFYHVPCPLYQPGIVFDCILISELLLLRKVFLLWRNTNKVKSTSSKDPSFSTMSDDDYEGVVNPNSFICQAHRFACFYASRLIKEYKEGKKKKQTFFRLFHGYGWVGSSIFIE